MPSWNQDKYTHAWNFAAHAHKGQPVPGTDIPYITHVGNVAMEAMAVIANNEIVENPDLLVQCALLHDVIEDTGISFDQIQNEFGVSVAQGVNALTKNKDLASKEEKMRDSLDRIRSQPREIWMVKLSDRITNLQPPPKHWKPEKIGKYRDEAIFILDRLGDASAFLAERMREKIRQYGQYF